MLSPFSPNIQTQIADLYISILGRSPDATGFSFWTNALAAADDTQTALNDIATGFSLSPEFTSIYGGLTPTQAINTLYQNILGRSPDPGGAMYWQGIVNAYITAGIPVSKAYALTANQLITTAAANTNSFDSVLILSKQMTAIYSVTIPALVPTPAPVPVPVNNPFIISGANQIATYTNLRATDVITVTSTATNPVLNLGNHAGGVNINVGPTPTGSSITLNQLITGDTLTSIAIGTQTVTLATGHVGGSNFNFAPGVNSQALNFSGLLSNDLLSFTAGLTGNSIDLGAIRNGGITLTELGGSAYITSVANNIAADIFNIGGVSAGNLTLNSGNSSTVNIVNAVGNSTFTLSTGAASVNEANAAGLPINNVGAGGSLTITSGAKQIVVNSYATGNTAGTTANSIDLGTHTGSDSIFIGAANGKTSFIGLTANDSITDNYNGTTINLNMHNPLNAISIDAANQGSVAVTLLSVVSGDHINIGGAYAAANAPANLIDAVTFGAHSGALITLNNLGIGPTRAGGVPVYIETDFTGLNLGDSITSLNVGSSQIGLGAHTNPITFFDSSMGEGQAILFSGFTSGDTLNFTSQNDYSIDLGFQQGLITPRTVGIVLNESDSTPSNQFANQINVSGDISLDVFNIGNAQGSGWLTLTQGGGSTVNILDASTGSSRFQLNSGTATVNESTAAGVTRNDVLNGATLTINSGSKTIDVFSFAQGATNTINLGTHTGGHDRIHINGEFTGATTTLSGLTVNDSISIDTDSNVLNLGLHSAGVNITAVANGASTSAYSNVVGINAIPFSGDILKFAGDAAQSISIFNWGAQTDIYNSVTDAMTWILGNGTGASPHTAYVFEVGNNTFVYEASGAGHNTHLQDTLIEFTGLFLFQTSVHAGSIYASTVLLIPA
jgi:hypothetical protein